MWRMARGSAGLSSTASGQWTKPNLAKAEGLEVELKDGRRISVPLAWYPRLAAATPEARARGIADERHAPRRPAAQLD